MELLNAFVEWFNGFVGLQYAGNGPIIAIVIGIATVVFSVRLLKFFFKPFIPLFQPDDTNSQINPVLAQQGVRHCQIHPEEDSVKPEPAGLLVHGPSGLPKSRRDELCEMEFSEDSAPRKEIYEPQTATVNFKEKPQASPVQSVERQMQTAPRADMTLDFGSELEEAWQDDQTSELRGEIEPLRPVQSLADKADKKRDLATPLAALKKRATASAQQQTPSQVSSRATDLPIIRVTDFGKFSSSSGATHRMAQRLGTGVSETLARIPSLAVEGPCDLEQNMNQYTDEMMFVVEGSVELRNGAMKVLISVQNFSDGSILLERESTCGPKEMQKFEKETALEIATAVITHQRTQNKQDAPKKVNGAGTSPVTRRPDEQSGSTYPSARHPFPEHLHKTDRPVP